MGSGSSKGNPAPTSTRAEPRQISGEACFDRIAAKLGQSDGAPIPLDADFAVAFERVFELDDRVSIDVLSRMIDLNSDDRVSKLELADFHEKWQRSGKSMRDYLTAATADLQKKAQQEAERIAERYRKIPAAERFAGNVAELKDDFEARRTKFEALTSNKGLVAAAELARELFPKPFEVADDVCGVLATTITKGIGKVFQLAPSPLDVWLHRQGAEAARRRRQLHRRLRRAENVKQAARSSSAVGRKIMLCLREG